MRRSTAAFTLHLHWRWSSSIEPPAASTSLKGKWHIRGLRVLSPADGANTVSQGWGCRRSDPWRAVAIPLAVFGAVSSESSAAQRQSASSLADSSASGHSFGERDDRSSPDTQRAHRRVVGHRWKVLPCRLSCGPDDYVLIGGARLRFTSIGVWLTLLVLVLLLVYFVQRTRPGLAFRAMSINRESAELHGINVGHTLAAGWALAAGIGALAATLSATRCCSSRA